MQTNVQRAAKLLLEKKLTIAFAESATAGRLSSEFSVPDDAGKYLKGAIVCYDACLKEEMLQVKKELIERYTPESAEVTVAITEGIADQISADIHIGVTGLPSPGGSETPEKPVGTMFIHAIKNGQPLFTDRKIFSGSPESIILQTVDRAAELLAQHLNRS
ncbi:MAG: CinA family protein [Pedobacter sp.]|nr:MAG: CinA family protein [Pedobacter sp.]